MITKNEIINAIVLISENENVPESVADFIEKAALEVFEGTEKHYGFWQLCPKCNGEPVIPTNGLSDTGFRICPVCNGEKKLIRPEIKSV